MKPQERRDFQLLGIPVAAMALLGMLAFVASLGSELFRDPLDVLRASLILPAPIGAFIGVISSPIVLTCLRHKELLPAIAFVYFPSALVVVVFVLLEPQRVLFLEWAALASVPAFLSVCSLSFLAALVLPNRFPPRLRCSNCSYDLRGTNADRCPECGWKSVDSTVNGVA